jgi:hypothetical protein
VRTEVGFDLYDASGQHLITNAVHQELPQQTRGHDLWRILKKVSGNNVTGSTMSGGCLVLYLCDFFHSFNTASTSSACPSGVTLGKMWSSVWSGPIRKVVLSMPHTFFPYMFFSFNTPN